jgi:hypothetical protein
LQLQARITKQSQRLKTLQQSVKSMSKQLSAVNSRAQARVAQYSRSITLRPGTEPQYRCSTLTVATTRAGVGPVQLGMPICQLRAASRDCCIVTCCVAFDALRALHASALGAASARSWCALDRDEQARCRAGTARTTAVQERFGREVKEATQGQEKAPQSAPARNRKSHNSLFSPICAADGLLQPDGQPIDHRPRQSTLPGGDAALQRGNG